MKHRCSSKKQLKNIIDYYESNMNEMLRARKFKEQGKLLMSYVEPGEQVFLIAATKMDCDLFDKFKICTVVQVEFVGCNNAKILLRHNESNHQYLVMNSDYGVIFFGNSIEASLEIDRRKKYVKKSEILCGDRRI